MLLRDACLLLLWVFLPQSGCSTWELGLVALCFPVAVALRFLVAVALCGATGPVRRAGQVVVALFSSRLPHLGSLLVLLVSQAEL